MGSVCGGLMINKYAIFSDLWVDKRFVGNQRRSGDGATQRDLKTEGQQDNGTNRLRWPQITHYPVSTIDVQVLSYKLHNADPRGSSRRSTEGLGSCSPPFLYWHRLRRLTQIQPHVGSLKSPLCSSPFSLQVSPCYAQGRCGVSNYVSALITNQVAAGFAFCM